MAPPVNDEIPESFDPKAQTDQSSATEERLEQSDMESVYHTVEAISEAPAGLSRPEASSDTTQQPTPPTTLQEQVHTPVEGSAVALHQNTDDDAGCPETTAGSLTLHHDEAMVIEDVDSISDDEDDDLEAQFDADLEAGFNVFEEDKEHEETMGRPLTPRETEEDASPPKVASLISPSDEASRARTDESPVREKPLTRRSPTPPKDWFGPSFNEELDAEIEAFDGWVDDDEDEEIIERPLTPPRGYEDNTSTPDAKSSDTDREEELDFSIKGSPVLEHGIADTEERDLYAQPPAAVHTGSQSWLEDQDSLFIDEAHPKGSSKENMPIPSPPHAPTHQARRMSTGELSMRRQSTTDSEKVGTHEPQYSMMNDVLTPAERASTPPLPKEEATHASEWNVLSSPKEETLSSPFVRASKAPDEGLRHSPDEEPLWTACSEPSLQQAEEPPPDLASQQAITEPSTTSHNHVAVKDSTQGEPCEDACIPLAKHPAVSEESDIQETFEQFLRKKRYAKGEKPLREGLCEPVADTDGAETNVDASTASLSHGAPHDEKETKEDASLDQTQDVEDPNAGGGELPAELPANIVSDTCSRETTAQLPETPVNETPTDSLRHLHQLSEALPNCDISVADGSTASERRRTESEAVYALLGAYLAASPLDKKSQPPKLLAERKTITQPQAPPPTPATGVPQVGHPRQDSLDSLPDYVDETPRMARAPGSIAAPAAQRPGIELAEPTPMEQSEPPLPDSAADNGKRRRSATLASEGHTAKRIRIVVKRKRSPQPPLREAPGGPSTNAGAVEAYKRRRSSDPGPHPAVKRPRILLKQTTPQPAPPQDTAQVDPSVPPPGLSRKASQAWLEDQISPKTVVKQAPPAEEDSGPKKKGTRKPKPPPPDKPSTSNLTWAAVESLLPTSAFGQAHWVARRFWTVKEEIELRNAWSKTDELALATSHSEVLVSRFIPQLYNCQLADLFRYGLRYIPPAPDKGGRATDESFWINLMRLLPHPFFLGKIEILRYALQAAVCHRTADPSARNDAVHVDPLVPPWSHREPGYISWLKELRAQYPEGSSGYATKTEEIVEASEWRCQVQVESKMWMGELAAIMSQHAEAFKAQCGGAAPPGEVDPLEYYLFLLTGQDLTFLELCLEAFDKQQCRKQEKLARTWQEVPGLKEQDGEDDDDDDGDDDDTDGEDENDGEDKNDDEASDEGPPTYRKGEMVMFNAESTPSSRSPTPPPPRRINVPLRPVTVDSSFLKFWVAQTAEAKFVTAEAKTLYKSEKRLAVIAERREALIRHKIGGKVGRADAARVLLDVPPFDPDPDFHLFQYLEYRVPYSDGVVPVTPKHGALLVVQGVHTTYRTREWLRWWNWERKGGGEGGRRNPGRRARADSSVQRVLGSGYVPAYAGDAAPAGRAVIEWVPPRAGGGGASGGGVDEFEGGVEDRREAIRAAEREHKHSVVEQDASFKRRIRPAPVLSMGGGLWARRKGGEQ